MLRQRSRPQHLPSRLSAGSLPNGAPGYIGSFLLLKKVESWTHRLSLLDGSKIGLSPAGTYCGGSMSLLNFVYCTFENWPETTVVVGRERDASC